MLPYSLVNVKTYPDFGSDAVPPQLVPPMAPGNITAEAGGAPGARYSHGVKGPWLDTPPLFSTRSRQACACSSFVSAAVTRSSGLKLMRPNGGGFTGMGCGGELCSPGTLLCGTGLSWM